MGDEVSVKRGTVDRRRKEARTVRSRPEVSQCPQPGAPVERHCNERTLCRPLTLDVDISLQPSNRARAQQEQITVIDQTDEPMAPLPVVGIFDREEILGTGVGSVARFAIKVFILRAPCQPTKSCGPWNQRGRCRNQDRLPQCPGASDVHDAALDLPATSRTSHRDYDKNINYFSMGHIACNESWGNVLASSLPLRCLVEIAVPGVAAWGRIL